MNGFLFNYLNSFAGQSVWCDFFIRFLGQYLWYLLVLFFIFILYKDKKIDPRKKIYWLALSLISSGIARLGIAELIRYFYYHPRPAGTDLFLEVSSSFPSGHTIFVFAFATIIYFYNKKWGYWFGTGALLVGLARIVAGVHWPSDILGGAILGILTAILIYRLTLKFFKKFGI